MTARKLNFGSIIARSVLLSCALSTAASVCAQGAYKIDETAEVRCDFSEIPQVTDSPSPLFAALNEHKDARAAIVVYGLPGKARRFAEGIKEGNS